MLFRCPALVIVGIHTVLLITRIIDVLDLVVVNGFPESLGHPFVRANCQPHPGLSQRQRQTGYRATLVIRHREEATIFIVDLLRVSSDRRDIVRSYRLLYLLVIFATVFLSDDTEHLVFH